MPVTVLTLIALSGGWPTLFVSGEAERDVSAAVEIALDAEAPYQDRLAAIQNTDVKSV